MASIGNDPNGKKRVLFVDTDGKRRTVRLGKMSKKQAESIRLRIEHLVAAKISETAPVDETSHWLTGLWGDVDWEQQAGGVKALSASHR